MNIFCSYSFTDQSHDITTSRMGSVVDTLGGRGHQVYCNLFDPVAEEMQKNNDFKAIFQRSFSVLGGSEAIVVIIAAPSNSMGQVMEIGVAMSQGKPVYLFEHVSAQNTSFLPRLATNTIPWSTEAELIQALQQL